MTPIAIDINVINVPESGCNASVSLAEALLTTRGYRSRISSSAREGSSR